MPKRLLVRPALALALCPALVPCLAFPVPALANTPAGPLVVTAEVLAEEHGTAADGSAATRSTAPGDRVAVVIAVRNTGDQPAADVVIANPVPRGLAFRGAAAGSPGPELSVDGRTFGPLASLTMRDPDGQVRAAGVDDVTDVRWRLASPLAAGAQGQFSFQAVIR